MNVFIMSSACVQCVSKACKRKFVDETSWYALFAPKGSPQPVLQRISFALSQALEDSKMREQLAAMMAEIPNRSNRSPEALAAFLRAEVDKWSGVIKAAGIALN